MEKKSSKESKQKKSGLAGLIEDLDKQKKKKKTGKTKPTFNTFSQPQTESFKGLTNFGNACYSNVVIQILNSLNEFVSLLNKAYKIVENEDDLLVNYPILSRMVEILNCYKIKNTSLASKFLKEVVYRFDHSGNQNDAHEFLVFLFDNLSKEMMDIESKYTIEESKEEPKKENEEGEWEEVKKGGKRMKQVNDISNFKTSMLGSVFEGIIKVDVLEKGNSLSKCQIEPFFVLSLNVDGSTIEDMFQQYFMKRRIEDTSSSNQSYFEKIPPILVVHVKGFYYDKKTFHIVKINRPLIFGQTLTIKKEYFTPSLQNTNHSYELVGFIVHKGLKASEGHYICYCKDPVKKSWYYLDDTKVYQVGESSLTTLRPYVMFYRKQI